MGVQFQSTLPVGGATGRDGHATSNCKHFNPRSSQGERHLQGIKSVRRTDFNPRSPQGERLRNVDNLPTECEFQSTLPAGGATFCVTAAFLLIVISIHAPRRGSDSKNNQLFNIIFVEQFYFCEKKFIRANSMRFNQAGFILKSHNRTHALSANLPVFSKQLIPRATKSIRPRGRMRSCIRIAQFL